jgi:hypothetical protein
MTKYISFSVYGTKQAYQIGALENAELLNKFYPGWQCVFYVDRVIGSDFTLRLANLGARVVIKDLSEDPHGMFWRFEAVNIPDAEVVVFRDTDSRLSSRESLAVSEWELSGFDLHVMRDHPFHSFWILGGMWGAKGSLLKQIAEVLPELITESPRWGLDQEWLARNVYKPNIKNAFVHDSFFNREKSSVFPSPRVQGEYVGESVDETGGFSEELRELVRRADRHSLYVQNLRVRDWFRIRMEQAL